MSNSTDAPTPSTTSQDCAFCGTKPAAWCKGCPREKSCGKDHHFVDARIKSVSDVVVITESAVFPKLIDLRKLHLPMQDDAGKLLGSAIKSLKDIPTYSKLRVNTTHAVLCTGEDPKKKVVDRCQKFLLNGLAAQTTANGDKPPVLVVMGATPAKALGLKVKSLKEIQSRVLPNAVQINGIYYTVVVTISAKMLVSAPGLYNIFYNDLERAFGIANGVEIKQEPIEELTAKYRYPTTLDEVRDLCDFIINYTEGDALAENWAIACDTETNTLFPHLDKLKLLGVSFAWATGQACYIPLWHKETPYDPEQAVFHVKRVFESKKPKIFHHGKYDLKVCRKKGIVVNRYAWDTMTGEHLRYEDKKGQYSLKPLTRMRFPEFAAYADRLHELQVQEEGGESQLDAIRAQSTKDTKEDLAVFGGGKKKKKKKEGGFEHIPLKDLALYGAVDSDMTRRHSVVQMSDIAAEQKRITERRSIVKRDRLRKYDVPEYCKEPSPLPALMRNYTIPTTKVLSKMEYNGVRIDRTYLLDVAGQLDKTIKNTERELKEMTQKPELNLKSTAHIINVLFNEGFIHPETKERTFYPTEGIPRTKKGQLQTTEKVLNWLIASHKCPFSAKKIIFSKATKAKDTFLKNVYDLSAADGRIHTNFNQHGTGTGRLSSNDENLQNIPKELGGFSIKKIFIPSDESMAFVNADAKNAEVRIFTAYSKDQELIKSVNDNLDTHCFIASKIVEAVRKQNPTGAAAQLKSMRLDDQYPLTYDDFKNREKLYKETNKSYYEMLEKFRTAVKRVVFGILYGAGPKKIAETIGISHEQAQTIIDLLFQLFPSIPRYMDATKWSLWEFGFVETFFGRRRRFDVKGATGYLKSRAERQAVNFLIQSTSSDIVLGCLSDIDEPLERDLKGNLLLTVHDSIAFELPKKYLSQLPDFMTYYLQTRVGQRYPWLPVAFKWDYEVGDSYGELMPLEKYVKGLKEKELYDEAEEAYGEGDVRRILADVDDQEGG